MNMDLIPGQNTTNHVRLLACIITCVCVCVCVRTVRMCVLYRCVPYTCIHCLCVHIVLVW